MPTPLRAEHSPTMDCYDALRQVAIGKKVARREWPVDTCIYLHAGILHLRKTDATLHTLLLSDGDLDAVDWYVVLEQ